MNPPRMCAIDIETTGLTFKDQILTVAVAWHNAEGAVARTAWPCTAQDLFNAPMSPAQIRAQLLPIVAQSDLVVMHNASFDLSYLLRDQVLEVADVKGKLFDTLLTARMTGPRESVSLANLCKTYRIGNRQWSEQGKALRGNLQNQPVAAVLDYNAADCEYTLRLGEQLWAEGLKLYPRDFLLRESDFCRLMAEVRVRGKKLNLAQLAVEQDRLAAQQEQIRAAFMYPHGIAGSSDREGILRFLDTKGLVSESQTRRGKQSVDKAALANLASSSQLSAADREVLTQLLELRNIEKLLSTYVEPLPGLADATGRVHPNFTVGGAVSYRLSSSNPNAQNIPRSLSVWAPFVSADYSQAELRLAAAYAQEHALAVAFAQGTDAHAATAELMFGSSDQHKRQTAKTANFAALYGSGVRGLARNLGVSEEQAKRVLDQHAQAYPNLKRCAHQAEEVWVERGYITLLSGKRIYATRDVKERRSFIAFNQLLQGGVAEIVKEAMLQLDEAGIPIIGQVHDSVEFPVGVDEAAIKSIMESVFPAHIANRTQPPISMAVDVEYKGVGEEH